MNEIERRNATYDAFVKMMAWVGENTVGLWDDTQKFCVSYKGNLLDWELNIKPGGDVFLQRNVTNFSDCVPVCVDGFCTGGASYDWDKKTASWVTDAKREAYQRDMSMYAIDGMFGMANRWQDIKKWITIRKENCNAVLNFEP